MKEIKAANTGNKIIINCAPVREVLRLKEVITREIIRQPLGIKFKDSQQGIEILQKEIDATGLAEFVKNVVLSIDTSQDFLDAVFDCLKYCTYKSTYRIDMDLFDDKSVPEAREDYYEILWACVEENLRPFGKSLISMWKTLMSTGKINQLLDIM
ncbi:MAG: hypothetical protein II453_09910 [Alphaproteobacteria bacterium]|nr:hypothetical protein [Alphaproteobacteria bacterium]MBQ3946365.1 hypothetical protein [Alphaproteobacteria bacterium]